MENSPNFATVARLLTEQLGINLDTIRPESEIAKDLGADSLDHVEIIMYAEEEFDIDIDDDESDRIVTVRDLVDIVDRRVSEDHA